VEIAFLHLEKPDCLKSRCEEWAYTKFGGSPKVSQFWWNLKIAFADFFKAFIKIGKPY